MMRKQIKDFPDYYVHSDGYVISAKNGKEIVLVGALRGGNRKKGNPGKYKSVTLRHNGKQVQKDVHGLVAQAFILNPDNLPQVNHIDGNKLNNNFTNLEWNTAAQNIRHSVDNGLWSEPTKEHYALMRLNMAKNKALFTLEEGSDIMEMKSALGLTCREVARIVGCGPTTIKRLARGDIKLFKNGAMC